MATAAQICTLATQIAKCPGYTSQAGILLNQILDELARNYDFAAALETYTFNFTGTAGPITLPANWLRAEKDRIKYVIDGVPYIMIHVDNATYDTYVQQAGLNSYPQFFTTYTEESPPEMWVWPPPSGAYAVSAPYFSLPTAIATPESSTDVPWFPNQLYLIRRLAGELMAITGDERMNGFLGDHDEMYPQGAGTLLRKYLRMKDDQEGFVKRVTLDRQLFSKPFNRLPNTKTIGW